MNKKYYYLKQSLSAIGLISMITLGNPITAQAKQDSQIDSSKQVDRKNHDPRPGPNRPQPAPRPNPRPNPRPILHPAPRPNPRPIPHPAPRPNPRPIPHPVHPVPVYPVQPPVYQPPVYPQPIITKRIYINRWVQFESLNLLSLMDLGYNYRGYAVNSIYVNVSSPSSGQVDLLVNGRVVDSITTYGSDVYLFPSFERYLYSDITYLQLGISGRVFIRSIEVKLQDRY